MTAPKLFEIVSMPKDVADLPEPDGPYYIAAKQALYTHKKSPLGTALVPSRTMPSNLNEMPKDIEKGRFLFTAPKLPRSILGQALAFFSAVLDKHDAEAEVIILRNSALNSEPYQLFCPYQRVTGASVHSLYDPTTLPSGTQAIGTIHSHCNMGAFHSGTDTTDASSFPGLHITIGHVGSTPTYAAMVMFNGVEFDYDIDIVAEPATTVLFPTHWLERVITSKEQDRAKVIAETMQNVSEDDKKRFLQAWSQPKNIQSNHWLNPPKGPYGSYGSNYDMWDNETPWWSTTNQPKRGPKKGPKHEHKVSRWNKKLGMSFDGELIDSDSDFKTVDAAIEGLTTVLERIQNVCRDWNLELGFEISDIQSGQTIMWNWGDDELDDEEDASLDLDTTTKGKGK